MTTNNVGSVWRKWDLHVHTPFSSLNNGFGDNWDVYVQNLFKKAIEHDIYAIGITDYFTIDGYKKLKQDYLENNSKLEALFSSEEIAKIKKILILPNIEFRLDIVVTDRNNKTSRVNFHVIFSEELPIYQIEENFLHDIDFIKQGNPQSIDQKRKLKTNNLIELGRTLKAQHPKFKQSELVVGMINACVSSSQICDLLSRDVFKNKYILAVPCDEDLSHIHWDSQGHNTRKILIQKSDCLMTSNPNSIEWGLGLKSKSTQEFIEEFKSIKPCIWGSDAHIYDEIFTNSEDRRLWIKSNLSFDGLKQIIYEPKRVFIGTEPENKKHTDLHPALFIDKLTIKKSSNLPSNEEWFDNFEIGLNSGLVAIIGNKGSGKSALADILGLCGSTKNNKSFSFLNDQRFNLSPEKKSQYFNATIVWKDKTEKKLNLSHKRDDLEFEKVKYIPQSFLEKLCLGEVEKELFENELRNIIFSRLPNDQKLGKNSLNEVINFMTEISRQNIEQTKGEINVINEKIIELEDQSQPEYKQKIYEDLDSIHKKLTVLYSKEPVNPNVKDNQINSSSGNTYLSNKLSYLRDLIESFDQLINQSLREKEKLRIDIQELKNAIQFFESIRNQIENSIHPHSNMLTSYSIPIDSVFKYSIDTSSIENILESKNERLKQLEYLLIPYEQVISDRNSIYGNITSLYKQKRDIEKSIDELQKELDLPAKEYQTYLSNHNVWQQDIKSLTEEISVLKSKKDYIEVTLSHSLASYYKDREELVIKLFSQKLEIIKIFKKLFQPVINFKEKYKNQLDTYQIDFDANFIVNQFVEKFESFINFGRSGYFFGKDNAIIKLNNLLNEHDLNKSDDVLSLISKITENLLYENKTTGKEIKSVKSQLKQSVKTEDLYEFLFNLDYLNPKFQLKLGGKEIGSLSPGERGALLLIFYLLLDNDNIPLIIDQPEENLDNQSIYSILVPFVKEAKERRQVILVTHNPNLAVVCDADQIVHVKIDKSNKHIITCTTGSIEEANINQSIIEVLEGTFPAFDTRNQRYEITRSRIINRIY